MYAYKGMVCVYICIWSGMCMHMGGVCKHIDGKCVYAYGIWSCVRLCTCDLVNWQVKSILLLWCCSRVVCH